MSQTDPPETKVEPNQKTLWPWMLVAAGFLALNLLLWHPIDFVPFRVLLFLLAFFAIQFFIIFFHELGHLLAAVLFRMLPATLVIGSGAKLAELNLGNISFRFCSSTNEGSVIPSYSKHQAKKFIYAALFAAGPAADFILLAVFLKLLFFPPDSLTKQELFDSQIQPVLLIAAAYTFYYQIAYLFSPDSYRQDRYTDARGIADALNDVPAPPAVQAAFERMEERFFQSDKFPEEAPPSDAQDLQTYVQWALSLPRITPDQVSDVYDLFVTATILYGWDSNLPLADVFSRELLASAPNVITFKGSRGAVLVGLGKPEEGKSLLEEVFAQSKSDIDRVISAAFIAIAEHRLGNHESAEAWLQEATLIDPSSPAIKRARNAILS